jgi:hypothetical protein
MFIKSENKDVTNLALHLKQLLYLHWLNVSQANTEGTNVHVHGTSCYYTTALLMLNRSSS